MTGHAIDEYTLILIEQRLTGLDRAEEIVAEYISGLNFRGADVSWRDQTAQRNLRALREDLAMLIATIRAGVR